MLQMGDGAGLNAELLLGFRFHLHMQDFDGGGSF
jgi:hypothetical protein